MIIPSLDFISGKIVRLYQGNYNHKTYYEIDIFKQIDHYIKQGAKHIHLVDLDRCKNPSNNQKHILKIISHYNEITFQVGGGIRSQKDVEDLFNVGVSKIVIGTSAILYPDDFKLWLDKYGCNNFILALDIKINRDNEKKIAIHGWKNITNINLESAINDFLPYGLKNILCTDISRDGTFLGPNINLYKNLKKKFPNIILQSSGGISSLADLYHLKKNNIEHVIIGRAFLEKKFTFLEAQKCWQKE
ncbi:1-(5-phosphoribosyl)-5-[(5-phosphoribosylamino)methylideneamino] imidazole-4-carboxamide isomerase [Buchnera aphidicola (Cinara piceae)]|uniref:1-(5-phosphoribosyl)-5-[(5-phosphoribosylamino)methylideneamino] imidazole-4-carboxamide isomerase n=1 Tax=Buchnera aphidicola (Cinara piceae) TaxID=1660043 RepID=A0A803FTE7_9GAMM|nr:1-(5-phosphoribosyl)-5-[(5-phosphoribosylamino)methylideneamino] imidazole-4-carboxamide isomerase [Buchnera aphidicola]VFP87944.1 1-(5-phosphoribosyl)-5-[(5-phosphoribosylamino)methylideneamino] imidazole-4-carboxamide isomerase [Buchnera aphidicola (Cinara piceae)]